METAALFAFGTLWFWLLIIAASFVLFACTEFDRGFFATLTVVGCIIALHVWGGHKILNYVVDNPARTFQYAGIYLLLGTFWGVNKWWFYVKRQSRKAQEALEAFRKDFERPAVVEDYRRRTLGPRTSDYVTSIQQDKRTPDEVFKSAWKDIIKLERYDEHIFEFQPDPKKHKRRILIWMTYWPWSFLWTMLNDPFKAAYHWVLGLLKRISNSAFRDLGDPQMQAEKK